MTKYGSELVKSLEAEIAQLNKTIKDRADRVDQNLTDIDDCSALKEE